MTELKDIVIEMFEGVNFPPGSLILMGSASHLDSHGVTICAIEWTGLVLELAKKFENVQVGPLTTFPREGLSGDLADSYVQLTYWHSKIYENNILGLHELWGRFAGHITQITDGGTPAKHFTTVPLPISITPGAKLAPTRFVNSSSCQVDSTGFDLKAIGELTRMLLATLNRDFGIACIPGGNLVRELQVALHAKGCTGKLILVGASNMRRVTSQLTGLGFTVEYIAIAGGIPSEAALGQLREDLSAKIVGGETAIVYDFFGNFTFRFVQADGSLALPIMMGGKHHLLLAIVSEGSFKMAVGRILEILSLYKDTNKIVLPPIPRYLKGPCCDAAEHGSNTRDPSGVAGVGARLSNLRKILKEVLVKSTVKGVWVPDIVGELLGHAGLAYWGRP